MRLSWLFGLVALLAIVAGDLSCSNCTQNDLLFGNLTNLESGKEFDSATPPPPPPARPPPPPRPVRPQPANNELWEKCRAKGCTFAWAFQSKDEEVGPAYSPWRSTAKSQYQSTDDLKEWFWSTFPENRVDEKMHDFYGTWGIGWALVGLGINPYSEKYATGKNTLYSIDHESFQSGAPNVNEQWYQVDNKWYRATGASYTFSINWEEGVIMGLNRKSPRHAGKERTPQVPPELLPGLNQFSDVAWIGWSALSKEHKVDINNLRYFISVGIDNEDTKAVILRAMNAKGWQLVPWPGHIFERPWPEMRAILGTPNVQGFGYFLIQHKEQLGNMFIDKLQVFHGETSHQNPCIVMHLSQPRTVKAEEEGREEGKNIVRTHTLRAKL